ncbi:MAG: hypothetical protein ACK5LT_00550, partial [Lachnospirales bacterium]
ISIKTNGNIYTELKNHCVYINSNNNNLSLTIKFTKEEAIEPTDNSQIIKNTIKYWNNFWEKSGIIKLNQSSDKRAFELERRIILSQYLLALNSSGSTPPQETGLTCNSWYGKMHLEMYLWHSAWLPLWNQKDMLERSLNWYINHLKEAKDNAKINGYKGARWPKMIATEGVDCPSPVAPLLVWQQPHVIYMLEMCYRQEPSSTLLEKYWILVEETAIFMADYVVWNENTNCYDILAPVIPAQECHKETETHNPAFELEYWRVTMDIAIDWAKRLNKNIDDKWLHVAQNMAMLTEKNNVYLAHEKCPTTFTEFNRDHPSMLCAYGLLPSNRINEKTMENTLNLVIDCWNYPTMWGWDFAVMAMTAVRLNKPEIAIEILLKETEKNCYLISGNNMQISRKDLPLYLPGNGSLLLAAAIMVAGYDGCSTEYPGFPKDGKWVVEYENIHKFM